MTEAAKIDPRDRAALLDLFTQAADAAGAEIMRIYAKDFDVIRKDDGSPVTAADQAADAAILVSMT